MIASPKSAETITGFDGSMRMNPMLVSFSGNAKSITLRLSEVLADEARAFPSGLYLISVKNPS